MILNMQNPETLTILPLSTATKSITPSKPTSDVLYTVPSGTDGWTKVTVSGDSNLLASNIRENVTIFGVRGTYS